MKEYGMKASLGRKNIWTNSGRIAILFSCRYNIKQGWIFFFFYPAQACRHIVFGTTRNEMLRFQNISKSFRWWQGTVALVRLLLTKTGDPDLRNLIY